MPGSCGSLLNTESPEDPEPSGDYPMNAPTYRFFNTLFPDFVSPKTDFAFFTPCLILALTALFVINQTGSTTFGSNLFSILFALLSE